MNKAEKSAAESEETQDRQQNAGLTQPMKDAPQPQQQHDDPHPAGQKREQG